MYTEQVATPDWPSVSSACQRAACYKQLQGDRSKGVITLHSVTWSITPKHGLWEGHITAQLTRYAPHCAHSYEARQSGRLLEPRLKTVRSNAYSTVCSYSYSGSRSFSAVPEHFLPFLPLGFAQAFVWNALSLSVVHLPEAYLSGRVQPDLCLLWPRRPKELSLRECQWV